MKSAWYALPWLWVGVGGALGAISRLAFVNWVAAIGSTWAIVMVNVLGSFLYAVGFCLLTKPLPLSGQLKFLLLTGFLGAFTTFSAFSYETWLLWQSGKVAALFANIFLSVFGALGAFWLGMQILGSEP